MAKLLVEAVRSSELVLASVVGMELALNIRQEPTDCAAQSAIGRACRYCSRSRRIRHCGRIAVGDNEGSLFLLPRLLSMLLLLLLLEWRRWKCL